MGQAAGRGAQGGGHGEVKLWLWSWIRSAWVWLKWFVVSPLRWEFLRNVRAVKARYGGGQPPCRAIFRFYHPAFWLLYWQIAWIGRFKYRGRWLRWLIWSAGGFVEMLATRRVPGLEK